jgi:outer membrane protein assembly factor BamB
MRKQFLCVGLLLMLSVASGCVATGGRSSSTDYRRLGMLIEPLDAQAVNYTINWSRTLSIARSQRIAAIELFDDMLVIVERPGCMVAAVSASNGDVLWEVKVATRERLFGAIRQGDKILVNSETRLFILNARTGQTIKTLDLPEVVGASGVLVDEHIIFGAMSGRVFAMNINSGVTRWAYKLIGRIMTPPVVAGFEVFVADANGVYAMLSAQDGELLWRGKTFGPITAAPATDRLSLFIACEDQSFYGLIRATGQEKCKLPLDRPLTLPPRVLGLTVYLPVPQGGMMAINSIKGDVKWHIDQEVQPIIEQDDRLLCAAERSLLWVDSQTGSVIASAPTQRLKTVIAGPDGSLLLISPRGRMLRLNPREL